MADEFERIFDLGGSKTAVKPATKKSVVTNTSAQNKPFKHPSEEKSKTEYVETEGGYMGEGCEEHYNVRFVELEDLNQENSELTSLQKYIVWGEILNNPKFKE